MTGEATNLLNSSSAIHNLLEMYAYEAAVLELQPYDLCTSRSHKSISRVRVAPLNGDRPSNRGEENDGVAKVVPAHFLHYADDELILRQKPNALFFASFASILLDGPVASSSSTLSTAYPVLAWISLTAASDTLSSSASSDLEEPDRARRRE
eukprot:CAMPEP_0175765524 /NCGR_PEP_ID=MMETSP0097-20121207/68850_1 /TAXON_ID=311494 /ORGANISM="Alexandrium monilatum, Strain CCMP3105" /LENGTH=151 /DNA_ID=CAMNT_0017075393 /DNA_START=128 /DNA_END=581 /DNA_ORIENTATION=-